MKNMVRDRLADDIHMNCGPLDEVIESLKCLKTTYEAKGYSDLSVSVDSGEDYCYAALYGARIETDAEYTKRLYKDTAKRLASQKRKETLEKKRLEAASCTKAKELALLEELAKKYPSELVDIYQVYR